MLQKTPNIGPVLTKSIANQTILKRAEEELLLQLELQKIIRVLPGKIVTLQ